jgi:hypothetical protein
MANMLFGYLSKGGAQCALFWMGITSVADPWNFGMDPDLRIHASDWRIRILLISSLNFKTSKKYFFLKENFEDLTPYLTYEVNCNYDTWYPLKIENLKKRMKKMLNLNFLSDDKGWIRIHFEVKS